MDKIEERLAKIETDIEWIKLMIQDMKMNQATNKKMWITIIAALISSFSSLVIVLFRI
ncbi:MAG: hypothetical protein ACP5MB_11125 [bacterium]